MESYYSPAYVSTVAAPVATTRSHALPPPSPCRLRRTTFIPAARRTATTPVGPRSPARRTRHRQRDNLTMGWKPTGVLRETVEMKEEEVKILEESLLDRPDHPVNLRRSFYAHTSSHHLSKSLRRRDGSLAVVAAIKRFHAAPPGDRAKVIAALDDPPADVRAFMAHGVDAALFYTDAMRHGMQLSELRSTARGLAVDTATLHTRLPLVRHDIIIDPVQIAEAAEAGAVAVNIVAGAALPELLELLNAATAMGMEAIVECHTQLEVDFAMECGATILFMNNWDRTRNVLVPGTVEKLMESIPPFVLTLGGGGLATAGDCWSLLDAGCNGVVIGETLLQSRRPRSYIDEIRSQKRFTGDVFSGDFGMPFSEDDRRAA